MQSGGPLDMSALLAQAQQMQQQLVAAQQELFSTNIHGESGGGLVKVTAKGSGEITDIIIDPQIVDPNDIDTLRDLILAALSDVTSKATTLAQQRLAPLAGGIGTIGNSIGEPTS